MQKQRFRLYRRNGTYYAHESDTGKQASLRTKDKTEAVGLLAARNQAVAQPILNVAMGQSLPEREIPGTPDSYLGRADRTHDARIHGSDGGALGKIS